MTMESFIGPILPSGPVVPPAQRNSHKKKNQPFQLPDSPEGETEEAEPESSPSSAQHDLPIGPARFDEAGQRIDTTA